MLQRLVITSVSLVALAGPAIADEDVAAPQPKPAKTIGIAPPRRPRAWGGGRRGARGAGAAPRAPGAGGGPPPRPRPAPAAPPAVGPCWWEAAAPASGRRRRAA